MEPDNLTTRSRRSRKRRDAEKNASSTNGPGILAPTDPELAQAGCRSVAEALPQLAWTTRPDGRADYFNPRWLDYTGTTPAQSRDEGWRTALHPDDRAPTIALWKKAVRTGEPVEMQHR